jgi:four helix bundle protein
MGRFKELKVWQRSKELAVYLYGITRNGNLSKDYGLRDQVRRAAVSISSNIAEGDELETDKQSIKFFHIAKGSSAELLTQMIIAYEIGYLSKVEFDHVQEECDGISRMLSNLIKSRKGEKGVGLG